MKLDDKSLRVGAAVILVSVLLRLCMPLLPGDGDLASLAFFLESGRWITYKTQTDSPPAQEIPQEPIVPVFSAQQAEEITFHNPAGYRFDTQSLLLRPLEWDLKSESPKVLIVHTHTTESYENTQGYAALPNYRTLDPDYNMLAVGDLVAAELEAAGVGVIHDRTLHDYPSYNAAYGNSYKSIQSYLEQYPDIMLVLDLHRDAYADQNGKQLGYTTYNEGQRTAQLMLVVSAFDANSQEKKWQENLALALKLQVQLQSLCPGISRPLAVRTTNYNQALGPRTLLVEVGAAGNTQQEALNAASVLAQSIAILAQGAKGGNLA